MRTNCTRRRETEQYRRVGYHAYSDSSLLLYCNTTQVPAAAQPDSNHNRATCGVGLLEWLERQQGHVPLQVKHCTMTMSLYASQRNYCHCMSHCVIEKDLL